MIANKNVSLKPNKDRSFSLKKSRKNVKIKVLKLLKNIIVRTLSSVRLSDEFSMTEELKCMIAGFFSAGIIFSIIFMIFIIGGR